jgi:integral membrane protein
MRRFFQPIAHLEGWSYLILLLIAMPLKYIWENPVLIRPVGMAHGLLFVVYVLLVFLLSREEKWDKKFTLFAYTASLLPFATFIVSSRLNKK